MSAAGRVGPPVEGISDTEIDGRISVYNPSTEKVAVLNETASDIWRLADGAHTVEELTGLLASSYGVSPEGIRVEVEAVVAQLRDQGFIA